MGYEEFEKLCKKNGVTAYQVSKATGVSTSTLSSWKKGRYTPKSDKLKPIADYFDVPLDLFSDNEKGTVVVSIKNKVHHSLLNSDMRKDGNFTPKSDFATGKLAEEVLKVIEENTPSGYPVYYTDPETAQIAQEVFDNPDLRMLFSAARDAKPEDIKLAADMLKRFKETNPDG